jgi:hypothetical protein
MNRKNSMIVLLTGEIIVLFVMGVFIIMPSIMGILENNDSININYIATNYFDNSTPKSTAISVARLNSGIGFARGDSDSVYLTPDKKYWIVNLHSKEKWNVTIDAKTLMSKGDNGEWRSLDELKAIYIADIQSDSPSGKPQKITVNGKEIWKVPVYHENIYENGSITHETTYVYVDIKTGKSKNTWGEFNRAAITGGWLTLKDVDAIIERMGIGPPLISSRDALRDLYSE